MPTPRSRTSMTPPSTSTSIGVSGGAELARVVDQVVHGAVDGRRPHVDDGRRVAHERDRPAAAPAFAFDDLLRRDRRGRPAAPVPRRGRRWRDRRARRRDRPAPSSSTWAASTSSLRCASSSVPARWSSSMFVRSAVSGVRSSWLASITSRRCCARDEPSAASIVLKLVGQAAELVVARRSRCDGRAPGSAAICSAASVSCSTGRTMRRAISHASAAATAVPDQRDEQQPEVEGRQHVVRVGDAARDLRGAAVGQRGGQDPVLGALDRDRAEARVPAVRGDLLVGGVDRDRGLVRDRAHDRALGVEQLHDRVGLGELRSARAGSGSRRGRRPSAAGRGRRSRP